MDTPVVPDVAARRNDPRGAVVYRLTCRDLIVGFGEVAGILSRGGRTRPGETHCWRKPMSNALNSAARFGLLSLSVLALAACQSTGSKYPETTDDGLVRVETKKVDAAYWREGATLVDYERVRIAPISVEFRKNWQRDQNTSRRSPSDRIRQEDMDRISGWVAAELGRLLVEELEAGGYAITGDVAPDVLHLRPAIVDLDVTAPTTRSRAARTTDFVRSAGELTLDMELYDAATNSLIGRVIDRRKDAERGFAMMVTSVNNRATATRLMRPWARALREALDEAHER